MKDTTAIASLQIGDGLVANKYMSVKAGTGEAMYSAENSNRQYRWGITVGGGNDDRWTLYDDTADTERIVVSPGGNVGIGTTSPTQELTLVGKFNITNITQGTSGLIWHNGSGLCIGSC
jgi:predicted secreted protein